MENYGKELTPVTYTPAAVKILHNINPPDKLCFRMHWHDRIELLRMHKGSLRVSYGSKESLVRPGEVFIIPPRTPHWGVSGKEGADYDVVMFDLQFFYNETEVCKSTLPPIFDGRARLATVTDHPEILASMDFLVAHKQEASLLITAEVYRLLHLLMTHCLQEITAVVRNDTVRRIIDFLEEHYSEELDIDAVCAEFGYSAAHLCRKFKDATGLTPMRYLRIFRLEEANKQLRITDSDVGEIAARCGFADANYFTRCFRKHFGVPPTKVRK